jgi:hypothetical protein
MGRKETGQDLAVCLVTLEKLGFGLSTAYMLPLVEMYIAYKLIKTPFKNNLLSEDWFLNFKKRNLSIKKPSVWNTARKTH